MEEAAAFIKSRKKINLLMAAVNILVFLVMNFMGNTEDAGFMLCHGACYGPAVWGGEYYRLFTAMFLHFGIQHLMNNMVCLIFLGDMLESIVGPVKYLIIYLAGGLGGNLLSLWMEQRRELYVVSAGASGAIFAVIGALLYIVLRNKGHVGTLNGRGIAIMAFLSVLQGFTETGTDNAAHVGGLLAGFVLGILLYRKGKADRRK